MVFKTPNNNKGMLNVPRSWEELDLSCCRGLLMIIGATDTGKSTFGKYLFEKLAVCRRRVAFVDGDPGQSRLGPPTTISLSIRDSETHAEGVTRRTFIGSVSPSGHMLQMLTGAFKLTQSARERAGTVIYDTSGLIDVSLGGINLKWAKIDLLRPETLFAIQQDRELESLLTPLQTGGLTRIVRLSPSSAILKRGLETRKKYRSERFARYFEQREVITLDLSKEPRPKVGASSKEKANLSWGHCPQTPNGHSSPRKARGILAFSRKVALFPGPELRPNRLVALEDGKGFTRSLGIVRKYCGLRSKVTLLVPQKAGRSDIRILRPGSTLLDPVTFEDRFSR